jgi:aryl-alcohol dehydrogenase-like predicted oxidoreductase
VETRRLGRTGHDSSVLVYGGAALAEVDPPTAAGAIEEALDAGINHFDVAASYGDAEVRFGESMDLLRARGVFLATKTEQRDRDASWRQVQASLERLRVDRVDLLQIHAVGTTEDLDRVTARGGSLEAATRAVDEGLAGAVGITGHGPQAARTHLEAMHRFPFATVLTPLNPVLWQEAGFRAAWEGLVDELRRQDAGLLTIKAAARRNWPHVGAGEPLRDRSHSTWYEPLVDPERLRAAVSWTLAHTEVTGLATPGDVRLLAPVVAAERDRMGVPDAESVLSGVEGYSSPFAAMPAGL